MRFPPWSTVCACIFILQINTQDLFRVKHTLPELGITRLLQKAVPTTVGNFILFLVDLCRHRNGILSGSEGFWSRTRAHSTHLSLDVSCRAWPGEMGPGQGSHSWTQPPRVESQPTQGMKRSLPVCLAVWEESWGHHTALLHFLPPGTNSWERKCLTTHLQQPFVSGDCSAQSLLLGPILFPITTLSTKQKLHFPYKATTIQTLQHRFWLCLPSKCFRFALGWQSKPKALLHPSASCFPSPCPIHVHTPMCTYPFKHSPACLLWVHALTAHHPGFTFMLEIGLVLSQTEMLLQMNQDFTLLGGNIVKLIIVREVYTVKFKILFSKMQSNMKYLLLTGFSQGPMPIRFPETSLLIINSRLWLQRLL